MPNDLYRTNHPGSAGNYIDSDDVNILPSDDAHGHQAIGGWTTSGTNTIATATDTDESLVHPFFTKGGFTKVFKVTYQDNLDLAALTLPTLTAAGHILLTSVWLPADWDGGDISIDDNGTFASETGVSNQDGASGTTESWQTVWRKFTPDAGDLVGTLTIDAASAPTAGRVMYFAMNCVRADQTELQVPSIRIVKNIDLRVKAAATDWTPAVTQFFIDAARASATSGFDLRLNAGGDILIAVGDGSAIQFEQFTPSPALINAVAYEIKATWDVSVTTGAVKFYIDSVLKETDDAVLVSAIDPANVDLFIGSQTASLKPFGGDIYWVEVRDDIGGPIARKYDAQLAFEAA